MYKKTNTEIHLSKAKLIMLLCVSITLLLTCLWVLIKQPLLEDLFYKQPIVKYTAASLGIMISSLAIFFCTKKIIDKRPGIIIGENGFTDNSGGISTIGEVAWSDIEAVKEICFRQSFFIWNLNHQKFVGIALVNAYEYILKQKSYLKRKEMEYNIKVFGTAILISANSLQISYIDLLQSFNKRVTENKGRNITPDTLSLEIF